MDGWAIRTGAIGIDPGGKGNLDLGLTAAGLASQRMSVCFLSPLAMSSSSGDTATQSMASVCPYKVLTERPDSRSQSLRTRGEMWVPTKGLM